jgi:NhaP-type Na+/H+ or K+/H+ antiporter
VELILVVVGAIVVTAVAHRRGLEPALIMVVIGSVVSFVPGFEAPELDSHVLLAVVLPPLLYSAALDFSFPTFLRNIRPILGLGVGLVVVTAFTVAGVSAWLAWVPLTFGTALVLCAIVARRPMPSPQLRSVASWACRSGSWRSSPAKASSTMPPR